MSEVDVQQFEAAVTLPFPDTERAQAALRGWLRLAAADAGVHPDWTTMVVTELDDDRDDHGRIWWQWSATVGAGLTNGAVAAWADGRARAARGSV